MRLNPFRREPLDNRPDIPHPQARKTWFPLEDLKGAQEKALDPLPGTPLPFHDFPDEGPPILGFPRLEYRQDEIFPGGVERVEAPLGNASLPRHIVHDEEPNPRLVDEALPRGNKPGLDPLAFRFVECFWHMFSMTIFA